MSKLRTFTLAVVMMGGLLSPTAAFADPEELRICLRNCRQAYLIDTYQPAFYEMCRYNCFVWYDNFAGEEYDGLPLATLE